jgi:hypothetical protein
MEHLNELEIYEWASADMDSYISEQSTLEQLKELVPHYVENAERHGYVINASDLLDIFVEYQRCIAFFSKRARSDAFQAFEDADNKNVTDYRVHELAQRAWADVSFWPDINRIMSEWKWIGSDLPVKHRLDAVKYAYVNSFFSHYLELQSDAKR